jgi:hypothetical protein
MAGLLDKLIELAEKALDTLIKAATGDIAAKDPIATIRYEKRPQQTQKKGKPKKKLEEQQEELSLTTKEEQLPQTQRSVVITPPPPVAEDGNSKTRNKEVKKKASTKETPQVQQPQVNLSPIKTALNAEALSGNQFHEFWDHYVNAEKNHGDSSERQTRFNSLQNELATSNQDGQKIREILTAIKDLLGKPLDYIKADIRGVHGMSPKDKDAAFNELGTVNKPVFL